MNNFNAKYNDAMKRTINAPCVWKEDKDGRTIRHAPSVDCDWNCDACGWNPRERSRRLETGTFQNGKLHFKRRFA